MTLFNPNPTIRIVPIPGHKPCIVIDDFLLDPQSAMDFADHQQQHFTAAPKNAFPGLEMRMPDDFSSLLNDFFILHIKKLLGARRTLSMFSRLSMITLQPHELAPNQRICHQDQLTEFPQLCFAASVLYLFKNPAMGGTSFYAPKVSPSEIERLSSASSASLTATLPEPEPGAQDHTYITQSSAQFELICTIPAVWNRVIFYDGRIFHSGHITNPELLSSNPTQGRLTLNGFFPCRKSGS